MYNKNTRISINDSQDELTSVLSPVAAPQKNIERGTRFVSTLETIKPLNNVNTIYMRWQYDSITYRGLHYNYSIPAIYWIKQRIVTHDMNNKLFESKVWWEDIPGNKEAIEKLDLLGDTKSFFNLSNTSNASNASTYSTSYDSTIDTSISYNQNYATNTSSIIKNNKDLLTKVSLEEVLDNPQLLCDFKDALDDVYGNSNIEFLENIHMWKEQIDTAENNPDTEILKQLLDTTIQIYDQFINNHTSQDSTINVPNVVYKLITSRIHGLLRHDRKKLTPSMFNKSLFNEAVEAVYTYIEHVLWPDFILTEEYIQLCQLYNDTKYKPLNAAPSNTDTLSTTTAMPSKVNTTNNISNNNSNNTLNNKKDITQFDYSHNIARFIIPTNIKPIFPPWYNANKFNSVKLHIQSIRGPQLDLYHTGIYLVVSSGSCIYKGMTTNGIFDETYILPVVQTTQGITITICKMNKMLGFILQPLAELNSAVNKKLYWYRYYHNENELKIPIALEQGQEYANDNNYDENNNNNANNSSIDNNITNIKSQPKKIDEKETTSNEKNILDNINSSTKSDKFLIQDVQVDQISLEWEMLKDEMNTSLISPNLKRIYIGETATGGLGDFIRNKVSKKKLRFSEDNFNLDLSYICPKIIAMGYPSEGTEGMYRNPQKQVQQFFQLRHPNAYKIYNLCSERAYNISKFENRVIQFPFYDHNPPPFTLIEEFCESSRIFLSEHPQNVISIHCKAGKGRTGTMIACLLVYLGYGSATQCQEYFGKRRTRNSEGVTIPSQIRYVHYFDLYCNLRRQGKSEPGPRTLFLRNITISNIGKIYSNSDVQFTIYQPSYKSSIDISYIVPTYEISSKRHNLDRLSTRENNLIEWNIARKLIQISEDVRLEFHSHTPFGKEKLFQFWINTKYIQLKTNNENKLYAIFTKKELDKATKDCKHNKKYPADLQVMLTFDNVATVTNDTTVFAEDSTVSKTTDTHST